MRVYEFARKIGATCASVMKMAEAEEVEVYSPLSEIDEGDAETLRAHILDLMKDKTLRESLIEKGLERAKLFTWEKCAERTADVYRMVSRGNSGYSRVA